MTDNQSASPASISRRSIEGREVQLDAVGSFALNASILSIMFCSQIAVNIGEFPASVDFFCYLLFAAYLPLSGFATLSTKTFLLLLLAAILACYRMLSPNSLSSWSSLSLLFVLYAPFCLSIQPRSGIEQVGKAIQAKFILVACIIAVIADVQLVLINLFRGTTYFSNIALVLPEAIRGAGNYAFVREGGGIIKANGFFLRESSTLSVMTAIALMLEFFSRRRRLVLCILIAGLLASVSGSGLLIVLFGFLLPTSVRQLPLFVLGLVFVFVVLIYGSEIPVLNLWLDRTSEFETPGSSGYARFVAPFQMLERNLDDGASTWLGAGAGTYLRTVAVLQLKYEINDPTWAKLIYEYGVVGFLFFSMIFILRLYSSSLQRAVCAALFYAWMSAGSVLKPDFVFMTWILTLVSLPRNDRKTKASAKPEILVPDPRRPTYTAS
ncbi:hypothetical protein E4K64_21155 [Bradyrhizobium frederickii]|uniref:Uncharacterized protein n=1 Tax=Bradyrhizobium frederickii TaxID=2560054 RepID=A0A4Y9P3M7_9BRAD|nr:hypothetical protein [Bradyrhizobium frederickii]TFV73716.1 hypothetical protein E4K64_21155 [Bradyrhizobium frederickii]